MIIVFQGSIDFVGFVQRARVHWKYIATYHKVIFLQLEALSQKLQEQSAACFEEGATLFYPHQVCNKYVFVENE